MGDEAPFKKDKIRKSGRSVLNILGNSQTQEKTISESPDRVRRGQTV